MTVGTNTRAHAVPHYCTPFAVRAPDLSVSKLRTGLANATLPTCTSTSHVHPKRYNLPNNCILTGSHVVDQIRSRRISFTLASRSSRSSQTKGLGSIPLISTIPFQTKEWYSVNDTTILVIMLVRGCNFLQAHVTDDYAGLCFASHLAI